MVPILSPAFFVSSSFPTVSHSPLLPLPPMAVSSRLPAPPARGLLRRSPPRILPVERAPRRLAPGVRAVSGSPDTTPSPIPPSVVAPPGFDRTEAIPGGDDRISPAGREPYFSGRKKMAGDGVGSGEEHLPTSIESPDLLADGREDEAGDGCVGIGVGQIEGCHAGTEVGGEGTLPCPPGVVSVGNGGAVGQTNEACGADNEEAVSPGYKKRALLAALGTKPTTRGALVS